MLGNMFLLWRKPEMIFEIGEVYLMLRWGVWGGA